MAGGLRIVLSIALVLSFVLLPHKNARAEVTGVEARAFMLTSTYGVLAGTLTGLATLAFFDDPGSHLGNVAVGASLGLYTGIFLGAYLLYFVTPAAKKGAPSNSPSPKPEGSSDNPLDLGKQFYPDTNEVLLQSSWQPIIGLGQNGQLLAGLSFRF